MAGNHLLNNQRRALNRCIYAGKGCGGFKVLGLQSTEATGEATFISNNYVKSYRLA